MRIFLRRFFNLTIHRKTSLDHNNESELHQRQDNMSKLGDFPFATPWYSLTYFGFLQITPLVLSLKAPKLGSIKHCALMIKTKTCIYIYIKE